MSERGREPPSEPGTKRVICTTRDGELAYELGEWICRSSRQHPSCVPFKTTAFLAEIQVGERREIPTQLPTG
jgi:hypothetical protein